MSVVVWDHYGPCPDCYAQPGVPCSDTRIAGEMPRITPWDRGLRRLSVARSDPHPGRQVKTDAGR